MSNDVMLPLLPGGQLVERINKPLRIIAPALRVAASCYAHEKSLRKQFEKLYFSAPVPTAHLPYVRIEEAKLYRTAMLPRAIEVRQAWNMLDAIRSGGQSIDTPTVMKMLSVLLKTLAKKKDAAVDPMVLMSYASLFDEDIDSLGSSLNLWEEVPRHPVVVALAIQYLFHKQIFSPVPAELCNACRRVGEMLRQRRRQAAGWLVRLSEEDAYLFTHARDEWDAYYQDAESRQLAVAFQNVKRTWSDDGNRQVLINARDVGLQELGA
jgi:hypothetical protein